MFFSNKDYIRFPPMNDSLKIFKICSKPQVCIRWLKILLKSGLKNPSGVSKFSYFLIEKNDFVELT